MGATYINLKSDKLSCSVYANGRPVEFSALHYSIENLEAATHRHTIKEDDATYLLVNYRVNGIGSNSCGPGVLEQYVFDDVEFEYSYTMSFEK